MTDDKKNTITWMVKVNGREMDFVELSHGLSKEEALELAKKRFHPMPNLHVEGDTHPFDIEVFEKEKED